MVAIDFQSERQTFRLLIGGDIAQLGQGLEFRQDLWRPVIELFDVRALERVLKLRARRAAADADILGCLQKEPRTLDFVEWAAQARDDLVGIRRSFITRLQGNEHAGGVRWIAWPAHEHRDVVNRGILLHNFSELQLVSHHLVGRSFLCGFGNAGQQSDILLRKKAFRDDHK